MNGFQTTGLSLNIDYSPNNIMCRIEGSMVNNKDAILEIKSFMTASKFIIGTSIAIKFSESLIK